MNPRWIVVAVATIDLIASAAFHQWLGVGGWLCALYITLGQLWDRKS